MKTNYNWETEEDDGWSDGVPADPSPRSGRSQRRTLLLLFGVTAVVFILIFILFERRLQAREELVRQNVLAAHQTWEQAVARRDLELFTSLLARDDADWFQTQRRLLMADRALEREPLGLALDPAPAVPPAVQLDANWRRAELAFPQEYLFTPEDGPPRKITLTHTQFYQLRGNRWQTAHPPDSFWGNTITFDTGRLVVTAPERDAVIVERLAADLAGEIDALCEMNATARECDGERKTSLIFETDAESLLALEDPLTPAMRGRAFYLPTPSLVGLPIDEEAYQAVYHGYTTRVLSTIRNSLELPIPLPTQDIVALCFPTFEEGLGLYGYNPATDTWTGSAVEGHYRFLQPLPDDSGVILRGGFPGIEVGHLQLVLSRAGQEAPLFDEGTTEQSARLVGLPDRPQSESLLLSSTQGSTGLTAYRLLPLESCEDGLCDVTELAGFPLWSPDGNRSLVLVGPELYLGDAEGNPSRLVGRAFSPFWLTGETFGYIRLLGNETDELPEMEVVLQSVATGEEMPLIKSADLLRQLDLDLSGTLRVKYVTANPVDPNVIFLAGTPPVTGSGRRFFVLKLQLDGDVNDLTSGTHLSRVEVLLDLDDSPVGDPSTLTPTGFPPFSVTPDGRWLTAVRFADPVTNRWVMALHDNVRSETRIITLNYPAYPAPFPFYDWSKDGRWLLIVDNGFFRLIAPEYDYERIATHDFAACRYPAWIDREPEPTTN